MTDTPRPLDPEHVDELLSADLDGELAGAAADLGYAADDVRAQIAADPALQARRAALEQARRELGTYAPLDEVTSARMRNAAHAELRRPGRARLYAIAGGLAAAIVIVVVVAAIAVGSSHSSSTKSAASEAVPNATGTSSTPALPAPATTGVDYGTAANIDALVARIDRTATKGAVEAPVAVSNGPATSLQHRDYADGTGGSGAAASTGTSLMACELAGQGAAGPNAQLRERGTATVGGQPVSVWVYTRGGAPDLVVVIDSHCKPVATRPLGTTSR